MQQKIISKKDRIDKMMRPKSFDLIAYKLKDFKNRQEILKYSIQLNTTEY